MEGGGGGWGVLRGEGEGERLGRLWLQPHSDTRRIERLLTSKERCRRFVVVVVVVVVVVSSKRILMNLSCTKSTP